MQKKAEKYKEEAKFKALGLMQTEGYATDTPEILHPMMIEILAAWLELKDAEIKTLKISREMK